MKPRGGVGRTAHAGVPGWLISHMEGERIIVWGAADVKGFPTPRDDRGKPFIFAVSWAAPMNPDVMITVKAGPNQAYAEEYARVNVPINAQAQRLAAALRDFGFSATALAASDRTDPVNIKGDFPHKTAATRAGLGWVGRHCQLVIPEYGPWVRLGTVFTGMSLPCGPPAERSAS